MIVQYLKVRGQYHELWQERINASLKWRLLSSPFTGFHVLKDYDALGKMKITEKVSHKIRFYILLYYYVLIFSRYGYMYSTFVRYCGYTWQIIQFISNFYCAWWQLCSLCTIMLNKPFPFNHSLLYFGHLAFYVWQIWSARFKVFFLVFFFGERDARGGGEVSDQLVLLRWAAEHYFNHCFR